MDTYEKKYKEIVGQIKKAYLYAQTASTKAVLEKIFPELKESEDERIKEAIIATIHLYYGEPLDDEAKEMLAWLEKQGRRNNDEMLQAISIGLSDIKEDVGWSDFGGTPIEEIQEWLEKQGEQKPTQETEPFEAEHGKYYYCIKDYFCGGRKQASKGDVIQALRGLPIMGLKDASEYFLPVNSIKCNPAWSEEDKDFMYDTLSNLTELKDRYGEGYGNVGKCIDWLKSLRKRIEGE